MSQAANRSVPFAMLACFGLLAAGCSDLYYDRRDTVELYSGDAVATNIATQTIDVWPRVAGERQIVSNGPKIQSAVERYRTNKVIPPIGTDTSSVSYGSAQPGTAPSAPATQ